MEKLHMLACAQTPRLNVLNNYASARQFFARLASESFSRAQDRTLSATSREHSVATATNQERSERQLYWRKAISLSDFGECEAVTRSRIAVR